MPAATSSAPAAAPTPTTSAVSPMLCGPQGVGGLGPARPRRACESRARPRASEAAVVAQLFSTDPRVLTGLPLAIDPDEVLRFQGYKKAVDKPSPEVLALFDEALALGSTLIAPRAVVRWLGVSRLAPDTIEAGGVVLTVPGVDRRWGPVAWLAGAACTTGDPLAGR